VVRGGWTEGERIQRMLSWRKTVLERKKLECKSFLSYVFKDISFPPECDDRIKFKTSSSIISPPSTQMIFCFFLTSSPVETDKNRNKNEAFPTSQGDR